MTITFQRANIYISYESEETDIQLTIAAYFRLGIYAEASELK